MERLGITPAAVAEAARALLAGGLDTKEGAA
jgi:hypothetical protein